METWQHSKRVYEGRIVSLRVGEVELDDGATAFREVVEHPGGVAVIPVYEGDVVLIRQFRIAIGKDVIEIPAGKIEGDEEPEQRGRRELEEETGFRASRLVSAGITYASVGYTSEKIHLFFAFGLQETQQNLEEDERIEPVQVPLAELAERLARNEFEDAKTEVGLRRLLTYLAEHPEEMG